MIIRFDYSDMYNKSNNASVLIDLSAYAASVIHAPGCSDSVFPLSQIVIDRLRKAQQDEAGLETVKTLMTSRFGTIRVGSGQTYPDMTSARADVEDGMHRALRGDSGG
jgi:hypothetical protein